MSLRYHGRRLCFRRLRGGGRLPGDGLHHRRAVGLREAFFRQYPVGDRDHKGEAIKGEKYIEFYVDKAALQQLVIDAFYILVTG